MGKRLKRTDPLREKFLALPAAHDMPARSVARFLEAKAAEKQASGYTIQSAGALYQFAADDLRGWAKQNARLIDSDISALRSERRHAVSERDELTQQLKTFAAKKGMA